MKIISTLAGLCTEIRVFKISWKGLIMDENEIC